MPEIGNKNCVKRKCIGDSIFDIESALDFAARFFIAIRIQVKRRIWEEEKACWRIDIVNPFQDSGLCALIIDFGIDKVPCEFLTVAAQFAVKVDAPNLFFLFRESQRGIRNLDFCNQP